MARITLTIDNGPHPEETSRVLDVLRGAGVPAYFFVVGTAAAARGGRETLDRIAADGHAIGNHTWSHGVPFGRNPDPEAVADEVERTSQLLAGYLGSPPLFRPFGGGGRLDRSLFSAALVEHLVTNSYTCVLWNAVPRDWEQLDGWVDTALDQAVAQDWSVLVVHDNLVGNAERIRDFVTRAESAGHEFVTGFPDECLPIVAGEVCFDLSPYTT